MRIQCAWCEKVMREGPPPTSHSICEVCEVKMAIEIEAFEEAPTSPPQPELKRAGIITALSMVAKEI